MFTSLPNRLVENAPACLNKFATLNLLLLASLEKFMKFGTKLRNSIKLTQCCCSSSARSFIKAFGPKILFCFNKQKTLVRVFLLVLHRILSKRRNVRILPRLPKQDNKIIWYSIFYLHNIKS